MCPLNRHILKWRGGGTYVWRLCAIQQYSPFGLLWSPFLITVHLLFSYHECYATLTATRSSWPGSARHGNNAQKACEMGGYHCTVSWRCPKYTFHYRVRETHCHRCNTNPFLWSRVFWGDGKGNNCRLPFLRNFIINLWGTLLVSKCIWDFEKGGLETRWWFPNLSQHVSITNHLPLIAINELFLTVSLAGPAIAIEKGSGAELQFSDLFSIVILCSSRNC